MQRERVGAWLDDNRPDAGLLASLRRAQLLMRRTPAGGAFSQAICTGGRIVEIVEYDAVGVAIARTYAAPGSDEPQAAS